MTGTSKKRFRNHGCACGSIDVVLVGTDSDNKPLFADIPTLLMTINGLNCYHSVQINGGEPLLHPRIGTFISGIKNKLISLTTTGVSLNRESAWSLVGLDAINVVLYHFDETAWGVDVKLSDLEDAIDILGGHGVKIKFICPLIKGLIDNEAMAADYILFAKKLGADEIIFTEAKVGPKLFVEATDVFRGLSKRRLKNGRRILLRRQGKRVLVQQAAKHADKVVKPVGKAGKAKISKSK